MPIPRPRDLFTAAFYDDIQRLHFLATEGVPGGYTDDEELELEEEEELAIDADEELVRLKQLYLPPEDEEQDEREELSDEEDDLDYDPEEEEQERETKLEMFRKLVRRKIRRAAIAKRVNVSGFIQCGLSVVDRKPYGVLFRAKECPSGSQMAAVLEAVRLKCAEGVAQDSNGNFPSKGEFNLQRYMLRHVPLRSGARQGRGFLRSSSLSSYQSSTAEIHVNREERNSSVSSPNGDFLPPIKSTPSRSVNGRPVPRSVVVLSNDLTGDVPLLSPLHIVDPPEIVVEPELLTETSEPLQRVPSIQDDVLTGSFASNEWLVECRPVPLRVHWKPSKRSPFPAYPLHWAVMGRSHRAIRFLVANGADAELTISVPFALNANGPVAAPLKPPQEGAEKVEEVASSPSASLSAGASATFPSGLTAHHIAMSNGLFETAQVLEEAIRQKTEILQKEKEEKQKIESELEKMKAAKERRKMEREQRIIAKREAAEAAAEAEEAAEEEGGEEVED